MHHSIFLSVDGSHKVSFLGGEGARDIVPFLVIYFGGLFFRVLEGEVR